MRCRCLATSLLVVGAASFPFAASAALIEVVSVDRSVTADADHFMGPPNTHSVFSFNPAGLITAQAASVGTGPTDVVTSSSQQSSVVDDDSISVGWDPLESTCRHASLSIL